MNLAVASLVDRSFKKIFKNISEEMSVPISDIQLGIYYLNGAYKYGAYKKNQETKTFDFEKEVVLENYMNVFESAIAGESINSTMGSAGIKYSRELTEKFNRPVNVDDVKILMINNDKGLPHAVLMCSDEKQRLINIQQEF